MGFFVDSSSGYLYTANTAATATTIAGTWRWAFRPASHWQPTCWCGWRSSHERRTHNGAMRALQRHGALMHARPTTTQTTDQEGGSR